MSARDEAMARLANADWLRAQHLQTVFELLDGGRGKTRAVGGAVRDSLLGRADAQTEVDLATSLTPDEVMARAKAAGISAIPTGIAFGTVTLAFDRSAFEVTTLRRDVETDGRHAKVNFGTDWTEDAKRRDFTLNALYCGPDGALFDPLGGVEDCLAGKVRFIGDAARRIDEDRLRVFRFFRFSASHGGEVFDPDGLAASAAAADELGLVSAERIGHEMCRILDLPRCARTLRVMAESRLVDADAAALAALDRVEGLGEVPQLAARLALLAGPERLTLLRKKWRLSNAVTKTAQAVRSAAALIGRGKLAEAGYRFGEVARAGAMVAAAEAGWDRGAFDGAAASLEALSPPPFPLSGAKLMRHGHTPGPQLGATLARLEQAWIDSGFALTETELIALAATRS